MSAMSRRDLFSFWRKRADDSRAEPSDGAGAEAPAPVPAAPSLEGMVPAGQVFSLEAFYAGRAADGAPTQRPPPIVRREGLPQLPATPVGSGRAPEPGPGAGEAA